MITLPEKLIPFLCYSKENVATIRQLAERLKTEGWIDPWFDEEDILPDQKWEDRVVSAVRESHAVIVLLSKIAVESEGFFHKELTLALDTAEEKPEGTIFIIPIRLDICDVPQRLTQYQYVDYFGDEIQKERVYNNLMASLKLRAEGLAIKTL
jgi:hypothetical protein